MPDRACSRELASGNILEIAPTTRLIYRYDAAAIRDLASAWTALPPQVAILVSGRTLTQESYDAAWRIGVALERAASGLW